MGSTRRRREVAGVALFLFAVFLAAALITERARPGASSCWSVHGRVGPVGACLRAALVYWVGLPAAVLVPVLLVVHALRLFGRLESDTDRSWLLFLTGVVVLLPLGLGLAFDVGRELTLSAGLWGSFTSFYVIRAFGTVGAWIMLLLGVSALTVGTLAWNPIRVLIGHRAQRDVSGAAVIETGAKKRRGKKSAKDAAVDAAALLEPPPEEMPAVDATLMATADAAPPPSADDVSPKERRKRERKSKAELVAEHDDRIAAEIDAAEVPDVAGEELPPPDLLTPAPERNADVDKRELDVMAAKLKEALRTFKVEAEITGRTTGPVVTQYEVEPAPGVKVRQIATLSSDLALAMRAASIRIVAPIPGRGAVGVEVPNPSPEIVAFRELIEAREFQGARAALPIALGKDLEGRPLIADLAKMPHLLIAGATGSGKSVCINTLITSLVYRHTPRTLRFLMVDPKMVELSVYNALPHLRHKVITDNRDAASVLKWAVHEMQERYELLAANGCRNIQDFNRRVQTGTPLKLPKRPDIAFEELTYTGGIIPYIVVVIDELADLMMTVQGEVETPLAMLAQKARAIGLHLILATQRPSVNVITGLIKANFPSRIAFRVASQVDSRTIIDGVGAEALLGNGDMLFIPPGKSEPARLQGAYISSDDTERLMQWYSDQREARRLALEAEGLIPEEPVEEEEDILEAVRQWEAAELHGADGESVAVGERDKLFREAAEVVIQNQLGSTSLLQRRLKIGYGRAARIIDQLHDAGVLGPADGSKARDVLVGFDDLDRICGPRG
ncbi:MAG TPA: DNA translocase FtsK 4TM domain-containing protein [Gemmatimonadaceae bacterium]